MSMWSAVHPILDPALIAGGAAASLSWWHRHAVRQPVETLPPPPPDPALSETWVEHIWRTRVDGTHPEPGEEPDPGCLPGTWLEDVQPLSNGLDGWEAVIHLRSGKDTTRTAEQAVDTVCSAFRLPAGSVIIEPTPDRMQHLARLLVVKGSPLYALHVWDPDTMRIDVRTGISRIGTFADGFPSHVRWFEPGSGPTNLLVAGAQGSGKSQFMSLMLGQAARSTYTAADGTDRPLVETWLGCGQEGQSFPAWTRSEHFRWVARTPQEIVWMVAQFRAAMIERSRYLATVGWVDDEGRTRHGLDHWDPVTSGLPMAQLVIDEAAAVIAMHSDLADWLLDIAKRGRKNGMRVVIATQSPSASELGGNSDLRSMLAAGGVVIFRVGDGNHGSMAFPSGECGNPADIPSVTPNGAPFQGAGFTAGPDDRPKAMMRTLLIRDPYGESLIAPVTEPHPIDARGGGSLLLEFWTRERCRWRGEDPEPAELTRMADDEARTHLSAPSPGEDTGEGTSGAHADDGGPGRRSTATPVGPTDRPALRPLILNAITEATKDGEPATAAQVKTACRPWWSDRSVTAELSRMVDDKAIKREGKGKYRRRVRAVA